MNHTFETKDMTTTSILRLFETTKAQRKAFVQDFMKRIDNGEVDPLSAHVQIKCMESIIKDISKDVKYKDALLESASQYGSKSFELYNSKMIIKEAGVKYDFTQCGDIELIELYTQESELKEKIKAKESILKTLPISGIEVIDKDTGEAHTMFAPSKSSTTTVSVTLQ